MPCEVTTLLRQSSERALRTSNLVTGCVHRLCVVHEVQHTASGWQHSTLHDSVRRGMECSAVRECVEAHGYTPDVEVTVQPPPCVRRPSERAPRSHGQSDRPKRLPAPAPGRGAWCTAGRAGDAGSQARATWLPLCRVASCRRPAAWCATHGRLGTQRRLSTTPDLTYLAGGGAAHLPGLEAAAWCAPCRASCAVPDPVRSRHHQARAQGKPGLPLGAAAQGALAPCAGQAARRAWHLPAWRP